MKSLISIGRNTLGSGDTFISDLRLTEKFRLEHITWAQVSTSKTESCDTTSGNVKSSHNKPYADPQLGQPFPPSFQMVVPLHWALFSASFPCFTLVHLDPASASLSTGSPSSQGRLCTNHRVPTLSCISLFNCTIHTIFCQFTYPFTPPMNFLKVVSFYLCIFY